MKMNCANLHLKKDIYIKRIFYIYSKRFFKTDKGYKIVLGADEYNNNPGWIHTQEDQLNLLDHSTWEESFNENSLSAILVEHV